MTIVTVVRNDEMTAATGNMTAASMTKTERRETEIDAGMTTTITESNMMITAETD